MRHYNKLVRDKIIDIIEEHNEEPIYRTIEGDELEHRMKMKIREELQELITAETREDEIKEFADLHEILDAYCKQRGIRKAEVQQARRDKNELRGKFKKGHYLIGVRRARTEEELEIDAQQAELLEQLRNPKHRDSIITIKRG